MGIFSTITNLQLFSTESLMNLVSMEPSPFTVPHELALHREAIATNLKIKHIKFDEKNSRPTIKWLDSFFVSLIL